MAVSDFYVVPMMKENPFYYDGIKQDEYLTEMVYYSEFVSDKERRVKEKYKPLMAVLFQKTVLLNICFCRIA